MSRASKVQVLLLLLFVSACSSGESGQKGAGGAGEDASPDPVPTDAGGAEAPSDAGPNMMPTGVDAATEPDGAVPSGDADAAPCASGETFTLTTMAENGTIVVEPDEPTYECGDTVRLTAQPEVGATFLDWAGALSGSLNPIELTLNADATVIANFSLDDLAPEITNVELTPAATSALVTWQTNELSTSGVEFGLTSGYELGAASSADFVSNHAVALPALAPATLYHYRITAVDSGGNRTVGPDATFTTIPDASGEIVSDDFAGGVLDTQLWDVVDPRGDGTVSLVGAGTQDAHLRIAVPAGIDHDAWTGTNTALQVMQPSRDQDFEIEAKFESSPSEQFQSQGLLVSDGPSDFLRFDVYSTGSELKLFSATVSGGVPSARVDVTIAPIAARYLRLARTGDDWAAQHSSDGQTWETAVNYTHPLAVKSVGVFAGNAGPSPAYTAVVDYFFDPAQPIVPEDAPSCGPGEQFRVTTASAGPGTLSIEPMQEMYDCGEVVTLTAQPSSGAVFTRWAGALNGNVNPAQLRVSADAAVTAAFEVDATPPVISNLGVGTDATSAQVSWQTDEPSTGFVDYGLTSAYEIGTVDSASSGFAHSVTLPGLTNGTTYHFRITASDEAGNTARTSDDTFTVSDAGPNIDVWYGDSQSFGSLGNPQPWINILGTVGNPDDLSSLTFSVNGAPPRALEVGPFRRLEAPGDFNIEIDYTELQDGTNIVEIRALDDVGLESYKRINVDYASGTVWPLDYEVDWSSTAKITDVAQVVDGEWSIVDGKLRTSSIGYDRAVAIGDVGWTDYEVVVPVTIHSFSPQGFVSPNTRPAVGVMLKWPGHSDVGGRRPRWGFTPAGGGAWYEYTSDGGGRTALTDFQSLMGERYFVIPFETTYMFKVRVSSAGGSSAQYRTKVWEQQSLEPEDWDLTDTDADDVAGGCLLLIAHYVDASFGEVSITPVTPTIEPFVVAVDGVGDAGQETIRVETSSADYFLDKEGGGLTSVVDRAGNDWVGYGSEVGFGGTFRGFPNLGGCCHPGYPEAASDPSSVATMVSVIDSSVTTKDHVRIRSQSLDGAWRNVWDFYPDGVTLTIEEAPEEYFVLYEGTPGGQFDFLDSWTGSDGVVHSMSEEWSADLADPEWVFFSDGDINRSLFVVHHTNDTVADRYWNGGDRMVVFGFGRTGHGPDRGLTDTPRKVSIGFVESRDFADVSAAVTNRLSP